ncbi:MAG: glycosyltransferase [Lachnospiraceae bacterium]|nr:glycosyltransferase [Lachnospiraceae bacterium]
MRIVFAKGKLETMDYFTTQMESACKNHGVESYTIDLNDPSGILNDKFVNMLGQKDCVAFFFNHIGLGILSEGKNLWEKYCIPVYDFIVDHPRNFAEWLDHPISDFHLIVLDENHRTFVQRFFPNVKDILFIPDGGNREEPALPYRERPIDVLYMGSCQPKIEIFPLIDFLPEGGADFFRCTISTMVQYPQLTTEDTVDLYIQQFVPDLAEDKNRALHLDFAPYIEAPVRRHFKQLGMRALNEAGVNVEVYGKDWAADDYTFGDNIRFHEFIPSGDCNRLAGQAKICLNFMPWFKAGSSERVFNSMLNGSVSISDRSTYLTANYEDGRDIIFYDLDNPQQMVMDIQWLLEHADTAEKIAQAGYEKAFSLDSWDCRFVSFMKYLGENV